MSKIKLWQRTSIPASIFDRGAVDRGEVPLYHLAGSGPGEFLDDHDIPWPVRAQLLLSRGYQLTPRGFGGENDGDDTNHTASENESLQIVLADPRSSAPDSMVGFYIL